MVQLYSSSVLVQSQKIMYSSSPNTSVHPYYSSAVPSCTVWIGDDLNIMTVNNEFISVINVSMVCQKTYTLVNILHLQSKESIQTHGWPVLTPLELTLKVEFAMHCFYIKNNGCYLWYFPSPKSWLKLLSPADLFILWQTCSISKIKGNIKKFH